jgi:D-2-hydroxyacid dehydrogenase (NADP+)
MAVRLLMSLAAHERFGARIEEAMQGRDLDVVFIDEVTDPGRVGADIGLLSRDITGKSTKFHPLETMRRFFDCIAASPGFRWLQVHSAGTDRPVYPPLFERGITITTASGAGARTLGVTVLGGMIALHRQFPALWDAQRRHAWEPLDEVNGPPAFGGATAVVVGMGPIGREIARLLRAFGLRVVGVRREAEPVAECDETITYAALASKLPAADWLVLACPLTETTRGLIDARALAALPPRARLVNVARGEVVHEPELIRALREKRLAGAWLDVFAHEPLDPASPLWDLPNVLVSPHSSARSSADFDTVGEIFLDNLARWRDGRPLRNVAHGAKATA